MSRLRIGKFIVLLLPTKCPYHLNKQDLRGFKNEIWAQRLINLEIPVLVRSLKSSNVGLGYYLDGRLLIPSVA